MDTEGLLVELRDSGVVRPGDAAERLRFTDEFDRAVSRHTDRIAADGVDWVRERVDGTVPESSVETIANREPAFAGRYLALVDALDGSWWEGLHVATALYRFTCPDEEVSGTPQAFTPVPGTLLEPLSKPYGGLIAYVWRHDCPPCETVRADFDEVFGTDPPADLGLFSVYGPGYARTLEEDFDVVGGPTTLFLVGGAVDARMQGAPGRAALEGEIDKFVERATQAST